MAPDPPIALNWRANISPKFRILKRGTKFSSLGWGKKEGNGNFFKILGGTKALHTISDSFSGLSEYCVNYHA